MIPLKKKKVVSFILIILAVAILLNAFSTVFTVTSAGYGTKNIMNIVSILAFLGVISVIVVLQKKR